MPTVHPLANPKPIWSLLRAALVGAAIFGLSALSMVRAASDNGDSPVEIGLEVGTLTADASGPVGLGRDIRVTLTGSQGCQAVFSIPNVVSDIKMAETSPGVYQGDYKVVAGHDVTDAGVVAELTAKDGTRAPMLKAQQSISIDTIPPKVNFFTPGENEAVVSPRPVLYCGLDDGGGSGVSPKSVRVEFDGADVTGESLIGALGVSYQPPANLTVGRHEWTVSAADLAGNPVRQSSKITIDDPTPGLVQRVSSSAGDAMRTGNEATITLVAAPGGKAEIIVRPLEIAVNMTEVQPGQYRGMFKATPGSSIQGAPVEAQFSQGGHTVLAMLDRPLTIDAASPAAPSITTPRYGDVFQGGVEVAGHAEPGVKVLCTVSYETSSDGGVMPFSGTVLVAAAQADRHGQWKTGSYDLHLQPLFAHNRDTRIDLSVVAVDAAGKRSQPQTQRVDFYP